MLFHTVYCCLLHTCESVPTPLPPTLQPDRPRHHLQLEFERLVKREVASRLETKLQIRPERQHLEAKGNDMRSHALFSL